MTETKALLRVENLNIKYPINSANIFSRTRFFNAVDQVSFDLKAGEILGLVGESGCGKSSLARGIIGLIKPECGKVIVRGENILQSSPQMLRTVRRNMQMIFQDPLASLDPRMTVGSIIAEPLKNQEQRLDRDRMKSKVSEMMERVGLSPSLIDRYPHQFSGGQCQRIGIARALILSPDLVICDEPVSALDVSIQAQIIKLLADLRRDIGLAMLFISHDLAVVKLLCDRVMVMYFGKIVEINETDALFQSPKHPYTQALIQAIRGGNRDRARISPGQVTSDEMPSSLNPPLGCSFHPRCPKVEPKCRKHQPRLKHLGKPSAQVACHLHYSQ